MIYDDFDYTMALRGNTYNPYTNPAANQIIDGIPRHTEWDIYAEAHRADEHTIYTPNTNDAYGGTFGNETNFSDLLPFENPQSVIVFNENQNYQGIAPMELQPLLYMPDPWEQ